MSRPGNDFVDVERFADIVHTTGGKGDLAGLIVEGTDEDDRDIARSLVSLEAFGELKTFISGIMMSSNTRSGGKEHR